MPLKFCANLTTQFTEFETIYERLREAKRCGFSGVEFMFPYDLDLSELVAIKNDLGLDLVLLNSYPGDMSKKELGLAAHPRRVQEFRDTFPITLKYVEALQVKMLHIMSGIILDNIPREECLSTLEENLRWAIPLLEERGIIGLIEPINNQTVPGYLLNDYDLALDLIKKINSPFLRLQCDVFHLQMIHGGLTHRIKEMYPYIAHVQIAQTPGRNEPDSHGEINYRYIFQLLMELGYSDWIGLEYKPLKVTREGLGWITQFGFKL